MGGPQSRITRLDTRSTSAAGFQAIQHEEHFHGGVADALVAVDKRVIGNEGEAESGGLVRNVR
jgi:hypothetical protein